MENITGENETTDSGACWDKYKEVNMCSWQFIIKAISLSLIVICIIIGNSLVMTAVAVYKKLRKSISNSFIASLALADFTLGTIILPFSLSKEIYGYWQFGEVMCEIWLVTDVWICTASILHLCAISLDRYIAIAFPLRYPTLMTHKRCRIICLAMWTLSFLICFPGLIRWTPLPAVSSNSTEMMPAGPQPCNVVNDSIGYTVYSALGSFFIPSIIMTGFYIKIFLMARKFMKQAQKGVITKHAGAQTMRVHRGISTKLSLYKSAKSVYEMSDLISTSGETKTNGNGHANFYQNEISMDDINQYNTDNISTSSPSHGSPRRYSYRSDRSETHLLNSMKRNKIRSVGSTMNKETRAAKTVAIIVGGFIACWTPFFVCYLLQGVGNVKIDSTLFNVFFWIGYINSLLNPCIYASFSIDYRHAFKKILKCELRRDRNRKGMWRYLGSLYVSSSSDRQNSISIKPQHLNNVPS